MVNFPGRHTIKWWRPMPLWAQNSSIGIQVREQQMVNEPAILRFANDTFMDELLEVLAHSPSRLLDWVVQPETWRRPMPAPRPLPEPGTDSTIAHLFNRTKQLTREQLTIPKKRPRRPSDSAPPATVARSMESEELPLKLFHAGHKRFYLVCASLISQEPGYPNIELNLSRDERTTFVVRRLAPPSEDLANEPFDEWKDSADEYAFVETSDGLRWRKIGAFNKPATKQLVTGEEQLPLFPITYKDQCGHDRQLHSGLIPVGKRETWLGAPAGSVGMAQNPTDPAPAGPGGASLTKTIFENDVIGPWKALIEQARVAQDNMQKSAPAYFKSELEKLDEDEREVLDQDIVKEQERMFRTLRDQIQTGSWYVLLDFARFLEEYLPQVWKVITGEAQVESLDEEDGRLVELLNILSDTRISAILGNALVQTPHTRYTVDDVVQNLLSALATVRDWEDDLESVENAFARFNENGEPLQVDPEWPDFIFPLADPQFSAPVPPMGIDATEFDDLSQTDRILAEDLARIDALADLIGSIVQPSADSEDLVEEQSMFSQTKAWFVVRCVYERPHCGPIFPALVSAPTAIFQLAPFFDPDAPVRSVRIPMPFDISPAGLRKYKKNAAFVISDLLCGQIKKIRKLTLADLVLSVLPWPFHKDLPDPGKTGPCGDSSGNFGMICSLSIPIVTLCALILLIIIVALFDYFFKWIPYLFVCLPIPGLKGKGK